MLVKSEKLTKDKAEENKIVSYHIKKFSKEYFDLEQKFLSAQEKIADLEIKNGRLIEENKWLKEVIKVLKKR